MNHIKNIEIKNFKSILHQNIDDCRRVNVFIGYPNVGKSNILEAIGLFSVLLLLKGESFKFNEICRVQHFSELYFNQNYKSQTEITINNKFLLELSSKSIDGLELNFGGLIAKTGSIQSKFGSWSKKFFLQQDMFIKDQSSEFPPADANSRIPSFPIKKYSFSNDTIVSSINSFPLSIPFGSNLLDILQREAELRKDLSQLLREYGLKLLLDISVGSIMLIKEIDSSSILRIPYHQIADTLKRLIFYKTAIHTSRDSVLLFEEPEAHMFPPYISKFTSDIINDENNNQYFIATHSPFVLNDFMEDMDREDLSLYAVGLKDGETIIRKISDDEITEIYQYGIDLFFNLENYLKDVV